MILLTRMLGVSLTHPHVYIVGGGGGGVQQEVGVTRIEVAIEILRHWLQVHVLNAPYLQTRSLSCSLKLLMGHHSDWTGSKK